MNCFGSAANLVTAWKKSFHASFEGFFKTSWNSLCGGLRSRSLRSIFSNYLDKKSNRVTVPINYFTLLTSKSSSNLVFLKYLINNSEEKPHCEIKGTMSFWSSFMSSNPYLTTKSLHAILSIFFFVNWSSDRLNWWTLST